jgi:AcrR family transcriptional regulator
VRLGPASPAKEFVEASPGPSGRSLPLARPASPADRSDAARNRAKILLAAQVLMEREGPAALTMDAVARCAGVGAGTVYRRFGDLSSLAMALLDTHERDFQATFMTGPPPLGPGAPAPRRLRAFVHALLARTLAQVSLVHLAETHQPTGRFASPAYRLYRRHVAVLLNEVGVPWAGELGADVLLAPLAATVLLQQLEVDRRRPEEIAAVLDGLIDAVLASAT